MSVRERIAAVCERIVARFARIVIRSTMTPDELERWCYAKTGNAREAAAFASWVSKVSA